MSKAMFTVREVARALGVTPATVYKLLKTGELESTLVGQQFRITAPTLRRKLGLRPREEIIIPAEPEQMLPATGEV